MTDAKHKFSRPRNKMANVKRHHTERFKGYRLVERWTNGKAAHIGFWLGNHKTSGEVSKLLADGTSQETIRAMIRRWRLPMQESKSGYVVKLDTYRKKLLIREASKRGITPEALLKRVADCVIGDRLYDAVLDDKHG
ncbi:hypothetical protein DEM27_15425 [Metarhizobium album]|uniref:Uncharacterized protein n=1 Tax=Metarhizobium album TaxID=2182425 RepID=A0A2U2DQ51_9HYPH|nr:hypothetical protein [Rhizobium album]PWE55445.1 hypothetical protein DEM27_15425 [Rhizobium album]